MPFNVGDEVRVNVFGDDYGRRGIVTARIDDRWYEFTEDGSEPKRFRTDELLLSRSIWRRLEEANAFSSCAMNQWIRAVAAMTQDPSDRNAKLCAAQKEFYERVEAEFQEMRRKYLR